MAAFAKSWRPATKEMAPLEVDAAIDDQSCQDNEKHNRGCERPPVVFGAPLVKLRERGIDLIAADNPTSFIDNTPTAKLVRQVLGAISEFDKAMTVAKLRGARERKRREAGKCEGRKSHAERNPELVALAKRLHRQKPKGGRMSLRAISAELAAQGFLNENGRPFAAASVKSML
jgi:hypothetical protein